MFPPREVELSSEEINGCHLHYAKLFVWIELSGAVKRINVNNFENLAWLATLKSSDTT